VPERDTEDTHFQQNGKNPHDTIPQFLNISIVISNQYSGQDNELGAAIAQSV
jgi:hypothetical protein